MKKTTPRHFEVFKEEVLFWINKFGLHQWEIHFSHEPFNDELAGIGHNLVGGSATFFLSTEWKGKIIPVTNAEIRRTAKHEAIELLLADYYTLARNRFAREDEITAVHHAHVRRLEKLIPR